MTGATMTVVGMPAADNCRNVSSRRAGVAARGSIVRASLRIERGHRKRHLDQIALRHARQNIEVAQDQRRLGHDADRMAGALEHFQDPPHHLIAALDRLIRIGIGADRDGARLIAGRRELASPAAAALPA